MVDIRATQDDCNVNLSQYRFLQAPLNWRSCQLHLPKRQLSVCTYGDFEPYGIEVNNQSLFKDLHDKTTIKNLKLKFFSDKNMKVTPSHQQILVAFHKSATGTLTTPKE